MNKEIKEKWIKALKSGEYTQGQGRLNDGKQMCCLGVLCDLYRKNTGKAAWLPSRSVDLMQFVVDGSKLEVAGGLIINGETHMPPVVVTEWAGIRREDHDIGNLSVRNDGNRDGPHTFEMIADIIDREAF